MVRKLAGDREKRREYPILFVSGVGRPPLSLFQTGPSCVSDDLYQSWTVDCFAMSSLTEVVQSESEAQSTVQEEEPCAIEQNRPLQIDFDSRGEDESEDATRVEEEVQRRGKIERVPVL